MFELIRAAAAFGVAASLFAAAGASAAEQKAGATAPASSETEQAVALVSGGVAAKAQNDASCPSVRIAEDGDARRADGAKATLDGLARDCANLGAETILKVALVGEGERKKDGPAAFEAPMTIQIRDGEGRDVEVRRINLKVEMPEGVQRVSFRHVEENVSLPPPTAEGYANWTIIVGLDPSAEPDEEPVAAAETQDEAPVAKSSRWSKRSKYSRYSNRSRSSRANAVRTAKSRAGRERIVLQPALSQQQGPIQAQVQTYIPNAPGPGRTAQTGRTAPAPVARPAPAPPAPAASRSDSPWKRVANGFGERRDRAKPQPAQPAQAQQRGQRPAQPQPAPGQRQAAQAAQPAATQTN